MAIRPEHLAPPEIVSSYDVKIVLFSIMAKRNLENMQPILVFVLSNHKCLKEHWKCYSYQRYQLLYIHCIMIYGTHLYYYINPTSMLSNYDYWLNIIFRTNVI